VGPELARCVHNTCGRHIIVFIGKFILGYSLEQYQKWLGSEKKERHILWMK